MLTLGYGWRWWCCIVQVRLETLFVWSIPRPIAHLATSLASIRTRVQSVAIGTRIAVIRRKIFIDTHTQNMNIQLGIIYMITRSPDAALRCGSLEHRKSSYSALEIQNETHRFIFNISVLRVDRQSVCNCFDGFYPAARLL